MTHLKCITAALMATAAFGMTAGGAMAQDGADIVVVGGKPDDPFWAKVKKGADDAGLVVEAQGGSVTWLSPQNYDNLGPDAANLIRNALSQDPDAIVGPDWVPEAMDGAFQAVVDAGVPLIIYNAGGMEAAKRLGALNFIGNEEHIAGVAAGEYFSANGVTNVLCVNTIPGAANLEARCKGLADGIAKQNGASSQLPLPATAFGNPTAVAEAIKAALLKDQSIDGAIAISAGDANSAAIAIMQAGAMDRIKLGSFDFDVEALNRIKEGRQLFAIDQQPYMQGYLAVSLLNGFANFGLEIPTAPILTGPAIVDASNVEQTMAGVKQGVR
jgi:simple sugar transport system substrate-binding protein